MNRGFEFFRGVRLRWLLTGGLSLWILAAAGLAQEPGKRPQATPQPAQASQQEESEKKAEKQPGIGAELAKETREAAGEEDDTAQFKKSSAVKILAKLTGGNLQHAYWLAILLNFGVIFGILLWAGRKYLPGMFRARTAAIQKAMEEARQASEDANRRLADVETRLARLGDEIAAMKATGEADLAGEEARIKAAAEEDGRKIVQSAEQEIAAAAKAARRDLTAYAADLAIALAKKQIHVDAGTDAALVRSFSERLTSSDGSGKDKN